MRSPVRVVVSLLAVGLVLSGCKRQRAPRAVVLTALGNEPFWNVEVATDVIRLRRLDAPDLVVPSIAAQWLRRPGDTALVLDSAVTTRIWRSRRSANEPELELRVTPGTCSDGMSDRQYPLTARVVYGAVTLQGCAMPGRPGDSTGAKPPA